MTQPPAKHCGVVTTIQAPTESMRQLATRFEDDDTRLIVVGDAKSPRGYELAACDFLSLSQQQSMSLDLAKLLPTGHYSRKNLGYLEAIRAGAECIYETDDDNAPNATWRFRKQSVAAHSASPQRWCNVYRHFTDINIWPRGFPLRQLTDSPASNPDLDVQEIQVEAPVQQGLANGSPDVDAIWNLTLHDDVQFEQNVSVWLPPNTWCPFNSQSTWWWPAAYPLMYLPSRCSFRMTDIWRSFITQRCLWAMGLGLVFHAPEVDQQRNDHDLMKDFEQEIPGYLQNEAIVASLAELDLSADPTSVGGNLLTCYEKLVEAEFFPAEELDLVQAWLRDIANVTTKI